MLYLAIAVLVGLVIFSSILFWGNRHIKRTNLLLTKQKDRIQNQRLSLMATNVNNLVVISDGDGRIVWVNQAFENLTGYQLEEVAGEELNKLLL